MAARLIQCAMCPRWFVTKHRQKLTCSRDCSDLWKKASKRGQWGKEYRERNREKIKTRLAKYRLKNKTKINEYANQYRERNRDEYLRKKREYDNKRYAENIEENRRKQREYYHKIRELANAQRELIERNQRSKQ